MGVIFAMNAAGTIRDPLHERPSRQRSKDLESNKCEVKTEMFGWKDLSVI